MGGVTRHTGRAVVMAEDNVSTDQIIPSREMKRVSKVGLGDGLFANQRYTDANTGGRTPDPGFVLNQPGADKASVLVAGANFGCGSSREHAVWALKEYGFRVIVAEGFGTIFFDNCVANGLVPVVLARDEIAALMAAIRAGADRVTTDLAAGRVTAGDLEFTFDLPTAKREMLLRGHSPIDVTLADRDLIEAFVATDRTRRAWLYRTPSPSDARAE